MIVLAAELNGFPRTTWVQATSPAGKRLFKMQDKLDAKGKPIRDKYGEVKRERCRDEFGKPIRIMKRELVFEGAGGTLGYLTHMAHNSTPSSTSRCCALCRPTACWLPTPISNDEPPYFYALRAELERRGYSIDAIVSQA